AEAADIKAADPDRLPGLKAPSYLLSPNLDDVAVRSHSDASGYIPELALGFKSAAAELVSIGLAVAMRDLVQAGGPLGHRYGSRPMAFDPFLVRLLCDHLCAQALGRAAQIALYPGHFLLRGAAALGVRRDLVEPVHANDVDHTVGRLGQRRCHNGLRS